MRCQVEPGAASAGDPYPERSRSSGYIVTAEKDTDWCEKGYRFAVVGHNSGVWSRVKVLLLLHNKHYAKKWYFPWCCVEDLF